MASSTFKAGQVVRWSRDAGDWCGCKVRVVDPNLSYGERDQRVHVIVLEIPPALRGYWRVGDSVLTSEHLLESFGGLLDI